MNRNIWLKKINYIENLKDVDLIKFESYSVLISFMLSKEEFKINSELKEFMCDIGVECKPYLLKSRTAMIARAVRIFHKAENEEILSYINKIKVRIKIDENEKENVTTNKKIKENYMKKMLDLYGRK